MACRRWRAAFRQWRAELGFDREQARRVAALLVERGYLLTDPVEATDAPPVYRVHLARTRQRNIPLDF